LSRDFIKVFVSFGEPRCAECGETLDGHVLLTFRKDRMPICLGCADLDHLVFLPSGNTALTARAGKYSTLSAVVLKWSRTRKRNERQGLLVEEVLLKKPNRSAWRTAMPGQKRGKGPQCGGRIWTASMCSVLANISASCFHIVLAERKRRSPNMPV